MAILIVTESPQMAASITAVLGGLRIEDEMLSFNELTEQRKRIDAMKENGTQFFETNYDGKETVVTWLTNPKTYVEETKEQPDIYVFQSRRLTKKNSKRVYSAANANGKQRTIDEVYYALFDTAESTHAMSILKQTFPKAKVHNVHIDRVSEDGINEAFKSAGTKAEADKEIKECETVTVMKLNIDSYLKKEGTDVTYYELPALGMLLKREFLMKNPFKPLQMQAAINMHGVPCNIGCDRVFTAGEAKRLQEGLPGTIKSGGVCLKGLLTTPDLFRYGNFEKSDPEKTALKLYECGLISNPYTNNPYLNYKTQLKDVREMVAACNSLMQVETLGGRDMDTQIMKLKTEDAREFRSAIIPFKNREGIHLDDTEDRFYRCIGESTGKEIKENEKDRFIFKAGFMDLYARVMVKQMRERLKLNEAVGVTYRFIEAKTRDIKPYTVADLLKEYELAGICTPEEMIRLFHIFKSSPLYNIEETSITLTAEGRKAAMQWGLCEKSVKAVAKNEIKAKKDGVKNVDKKSFMQEALKTVSEELECSREEFKQLLLDLREDIDRKEKEESGEKTDENLLALRMEGEHMCPVCHEKAMDLKDGVYICSECGKRIPEKIEKNGFVFRITERDIENLEKKGRTSYKTASSNGETKAIFITIDDKGTLGATNKSDVRCPFCGSSLKVHSWGFSCDGCKFFAPFEVAGVKLSGRHLKALFAGEKTPPIPGLRIPGTDRDACLSIDANGKVTPL